MTLKTINTAELRPHTQLIHSGRDSLLRYIKFTMNNNLQASENQRINLRNRYLLVIRQNHLVNSIENVRYRKGVN